LEGDFNQGVKLVDENGDNLGSEGV
jgi:hypothetical protein